MRIEAGYYPDRQTNAAKDSTMVNVVSGGCTFRMGARKALRLICVAILFLSHHSPSRAQDLYADAELYERLQSAVADWIIDHPGAALKGFSVSNLRVTNINITPNIYSKAAYDDYLKTCLTGFAANSPTPLSLNDFARCSSKARDIAKQTVEPSVIKRRKIIDYRNCTALEIDEQLDFKREIKKGQKYENRRNIKSTSQLKKSVSVGVDVSFFKSIEFNGKTSYETSLTHEVDLSDSKANDWSETITDGFKTNFKLKPGDGIRFTLTWQEASIPIDFKNTVTFDGDVSINFYIMAPIPQPAEGLYQLVKLSELLSEEERSVSSDSFLIGFENEEVDRRGDKLDCSPGESNRTVQEKNFVQPGLFAGIAKGGFDADVITQLVDATSFGRKVAIHTAGSLGRSHMSKPISKSPPNKTLPWRLVQPLALQSSGDWCYTGPCADPLDGTREECYLECLNEDDEGNCEGLACTDCRAIDDFSCEPGETYEDE